MFSAAGTPTDSLTTHVAIYAGDADQLTRIQAANVVESLGATGVEIYREAPGANPVPWSDPRSVLSTFMVNRSRFHTLVVEHHGVFADRPEDAAAVLAAVRCSGVNVVTLH